jgi:hypothetical protein
MRNAPQRAKGSSWIMSIKSLKTIVLSVIVGALVACAAAPQTPKPKPPPPAQNLLGSTDELQLVAELSLDLAKTYGGDQVLVVLDIDNTLLAMDQDLGSDQWYYWQKALQEDDPCSPLLVGDRLEVQGALYFVSAMHPTQPDAAQQVARMQEAGLKVIVLTARGPGFSLSTFRELRRNGFNFWQSAWPPQKGFADPFVPEGGTRDAVYQDGVLFAAGQDKGLTLKTMLDKSGVPYPKLIVMADDKQSNLNQVMQAFAWSPTRVQAWRYTREDATVEAFDPDKAAALWSELKPPMEQIEKLMGSENYRLSPDTLPEGCEPKS